MLIRRRIPLMTRKKMRWLPLKSDDEKHFPLTVKLKLKSQLKTAVKTNVLTGVEIKAGIMVDLRRKKRRSLEHVTAMCMSGRRPKINRRTRRTRKRTRIKVNRKTTKENVEKRKNGN